MSQNLRTFTGAVYAFDALVRRMPEAAWTAESGCEGWSGSELLSHQIAVLNGVAEMARTGAMARPTPPDNVDDPVAAWSTCRDALLDALDQPNVLQQEGPFWFDQANIDAVLGVVQWDPLAHSWDLAKCHGLDPALDERLVEASWAVLEPMVPMLIESGRIQPSLEVPADADITTRYLAALGRQA